MPAGASFERAASPSAAASVRGDRGFAHGEFRASDFESVERDASKRSVQSRSAASRLRAPAEDCLDAGHERGILQQRRPTQGGAAGSRVEPVPVEYGASFMPASARPATPAIRWLRRA
jgi:hypothetical protein